MSVDLTPEQKTQERHQNQMAALASDLGFGKALERFCLAKYGVSYFSLEYREVLDVQDTFLPILVEIKRQLRGKGQ